MKVTIMGQSDNMIKMVIGNKKVFNNLAFCNESLIDLV